jgi:hypothetical protein
MIQECLNHGKVTQGIKGPIQRNFKPEDEVAKTECSNLGFRMDRYLVGFGKILPYPCQRAMSCCLYIHMLRPIDVTNN